MMPSVITVTLAITMIVTGYTDCDPGMKCDGITTSGVKTWDGCVACGLRFELGTVFEIPKLGRYFRCADRGNLIEDNNLDIWMNDRSEALAFGVQILDVKVYSEMPSPKRIQEKKMPRNNGEKLAAKHRIGHYVAYDLYDMMDKTAIMTYHPLYYNAQCLHPTLPHNLGVSLASRISQPKPLAWQHLSGGKQQPQAPKPRRPLN